MYTTVTGKIKSLDATGTFPRMADVITGKIVKKVCVDLLPSIQVDDYVLVQAGFAVSIINMRNANASLETILMPDDLKTKNYGDR